MGGHADVNELPTYQTSDHIESVLETASEFGELAAAERDFASIARGFASQSGRDQPLALAPE